MKVCLVSNQTINNVWQEKLSDLESDLTVFGFNGLGLVSYKKELSGETEYFSDVAKLSKQLQNVIICGCDTDTYGVYRHSAVVAENGKILGVTDMTHSIDDSEFVSGANLRVYETKKGKIGVLIGDDLFFPDNAKILSLCDADIIVCIMNKVESVIPEITIRSSAYCNGLPFALCSRNYSTLSDQKGEIRFAGDKIVKGLIEIEKNYHLVSERRRGLIK